MGEPLERRRGAGRRRSDSRETREVRGLLHDLGHEMTTLSYLVEAVRGDVSLPEDSNYRLELLSLEMARLTGLITHGLTGTEPAAQGRRTGLRELLTQLVRLADLAGGASVSLLPGPEVMTDVNPVLLWRVASNVIDNATRAAGTGGQVTVAVARQAGAVIEVTDDGPGLAAGPPGMASLGLDIVASLLGACGGSLELVSPPAGGTVARVVLPGLVASVTGTSRG
jgi:signal transduction histidine kinase